MSWRQSTEKNRQKNRKELSRYQALYVWKARMSLTSPGSLTVEAAIVLPIFLMAAAAFLSLFWLMYFQIHLQCAMEYAAQKASTYYYAVDLIQNGNDDRETLQEKGGIEEDLLIWGITALYLKREILSDLEEENVSISHIYGGEHGIVLLGSAFPDENGMIDLIVNYAMKIPYFPGPIGKITCSQRTRRKIWTGIASQTEPEPEDRKEEDTVVYVTQYGKVYHLTLECSHLNLHITPVTADVLISARNESGEKYYACEKCVSGFTTLTYYITDDGNRYHTDRKCSGLIRSIREIKLSETGLPACKTCGKDD